MNQFDEKRIRRGKTARDRNSGAHARNAANRAQRGEWSRDGGVSPRCTTEFPHWTCRGRTNSSKNNGIRA